MPSAELTQLTRAVLSGAARQDGRTEGGTSVPRGPSHADDIKREGEDFVDEHGSPEEAELNDLREDREKE